MRLGFMRPEPYVEESEEKCEAIDVDTVAAPSMRFEPVRDEIERFVQGVRTGDLDAVLFTSRTTVKVLTQEAPEVHRFNDADVDVVAIGGKTRDELETRGVEVDEVPERSDSVGVENLLQRKKGWGTVYLPRSEASESFLPNLSTEKDVQQFCVYRPRYLESSLDAKFLINLVQYNFIDAYLFTSPSNVDYFLNVAEETVENIGLVQAFNNDGPVVTAIGPTTEKYLEDVGIEVDAKPETPGFVEAVEAAEKEYLSRKEGQR